MAFTNINKPSDYFNTVLYTGNGSTQSITGVNFQPDLVWFKNRTSTYNHKFYDVVRGVTKELDPNNINAENTTTDEITSFDSDGFSVAGGSAVNQNTANIVAWNWLTDNTSGSSNTDGSITSTVSANTTSGFSIVSFTGTASNATVGHGLSQAPEIYIVKNRASATDWRVAQTITPTNNMTSGNGYYMELNDTKASTNPGSASQWGNPPTAPTSTVVSVGTSSPVNGSGNAMIIYCFHSVKGFSKMGYYTGTGGGSGLIDTGPFIYTGFKPAFFIFKRSDSANDWFVLDNKRDPYNITDAALFPGLSAAESDGGGSYNGVDFLSNGIKIRNGNTSINASGGTFIYMAFAESPFTTSTGIPTTAR